MAGIKSIKRKDVVVPMLNGHRHFRADLQEMASRGLLAHLALQRGVRLPPLSRVAKTTPLSPRVLHGMWIVDCPDCRGAELLWEQEKLFMCCGCWNAIVGGGWRPVAVPGHKPLIEAALLARPIAQNRNWYPGEPLDNLHQENIRHALPQEVDDD